MKPPTFLSIFTEKHEGPSHQAVLVFRFASAAFAVFGRRKPSIYGKCNNPHGHGHNYALEITVAAV